MEGIVANIVGQISSARRPVTILFSDIEGSTAYWDKYGDMAGRLMIDRHNRLMFPIVKRFGGRVIKTIGDSIMAAFNDPEDALKGAVAMQQFLKKNRDESDMFYPKIRIGLHSGEGIVERTDVFGDVVNVAARVESKAKGDQVLISDQTAAQLAQPEKYFLKKQGSFLPKGKSTEISIHDCDWRQCMDLASGLKVDTLAMLLGQHRKQVVLWVAVTLIVCYFLFDRYVRFLVADNPAHALVFLNQDVFLARYGWQIAGYALLLVIGWLWLLRTSFLATWALRMIKGVFGFALFFFVFYLVFIPGFSISEGMETGQLADLAQTNAEDASLPWSEILHESDYLFVEVLEDRSFIYASPAVTSKPLQQVDKGVLLLLIDTAKKGESRWNKVLVWENQYGWIQRKTPPEMGVAPRRITIAGKFYFRYRDAYALLAGLIGFFWGFISLRIRPL